MPFSLPPTPATIYDALFLEVQRGSIFSDQKTFVDCLPRLPPEAIMEKYRAARQSGAGFDLHAFVLEHFVIPEPEHVQAPPAASLAQHLQRAWQMLRREADPVIAGSSLLPLAHPYVVPGGRFREIYYWDSYFTMLGLRVHGHNDLVRTLIANLADLLLRYGLIPNGNRSYYLTRSHPPLFALMVELLAEIDGPGVFSRYRPALEAELDYWNDRTAPTAHRISLPGGATLHRYFDQADHPRLEAYLFDEAINAHSRQDPAFLYRHIRSATESGWDFSSRWFIGGTTMANIRTADLVPVDLNCFLHRLERTLVRACAEDGDLEKSRQYEHAAAERLAAIQEACWSPTEEFFFDYHPAAAARSPHRTLAAATPLFLGQATAAQAEAVARILRTEFLRPGGLVTTLTASGEQWDAPNGWAPLHWMAIAGLKAYGHRELAGEIARRWIGLNVAVYARTGRLMEKYNVEDLSLPAGGGEYPTQDGFGWTNGVLLKLFDEHPECA
ncbi:MAG TPA: trehalase family glycosidase [Candidatus Didemnitutus sp.]